jgi:hypothetical protein
VTGSAEAYAAVVEPRPEFYGAGGLAAVPANDMNNPKKSEELRAKTNEVIAGEIVVALQETAVKVEAEQEQKKTAKPKAKAVQVPGLKTKKSEQPIVDLHSQERVYTDPEADYSIAKNGTVKVSIYKPGNYASQNYAQLTGMQFPTDESLLDLHAPA